MPNIGESITTPLHDASDKLGHPENCAGRIQQLGAVGKGAVQEARKQLFGQRVDFASVTLPLDFLVSQFVERATATLSHVQPGEYKLKDVHDLLVSITNSEHIARQLFDRMLADNVAFINDLGQVFFRGYGQLPNQRTADTNTTKDTTDKTL